MKPKYLNRIRLLFPINTINILEGLYKSIYSNNNKEFKSLKEYTIYDDIKNIDWKSSAKTNNLLIKEHEANNNHNITIILDTGKRFEADTNKHERKKDVLINITSILSYLSISNNDKVSLIYNDKYENFTNNHNLIETFLDTYENNIINQKDLSTSINYIIRNLQKKSIIYIITDLKGLNKIKEEELNILSKRHKIIIININDNYLHKDNILNIDTNKYIPSFLRKDKKLHQEELRIRNEILNENYNKLKKYKINLTTIDNSDEIIEKLIILLKEYKKWKNFK